MENKNLTQYCDNTKKYCYSSQSKAYRAKNRYDDIKRIYYCNSCSCWHTTSLKTHEVIRLGVIKQPQKKDKVNIGDIQKRLEDLNKNKDEKNT